MSDVPNSPANTPETQAGSPRENEHEPATRSPSVDAQLASENSGQEATPAESAPGAATPDSVTPDSATPDSATPDSATPDSGTPDSGTQEMATPETAPPNAVPAESAQAPGAETPTTVETSQTDNDSADHAGQDASDSSSSRRKGPEFLQAEVLRVTNDALEVKLPEDRQGRVALTEYEGLTVPPVGECIPVRVDTLDDGDLLIHRVSDAEHTFWGSVKEGDELDGVVTGMNKGGLDIDIGGARAFLPASHVDVKPVKDISVYIGEHVTCIVSQVDRTSRDLVVSRRKYLRRANKQKRNELFEGLEDGQTRTGKVASVTDYGVFVDLGGANGLLHMSDMTWGRIKHPSELVKPDQELEVKILKVDAKKQKISLGLKQLQPDPWDNMQERYAKDAKVKGKVISLTDFGAFIELEPGIEALLPLSEMSWSRNVSRPSDMVSEGQDVEAVVLRVDPEKRKISVGTRQLQDNPWADIETRFPVNDTFKGKVTRTAEFGAFVEVAEGVEGLVHISELSDKRVRAVTDVVKEGAEVEVRVLKVDAKAQRLSLSMKPLTKQDIEDAKPRKKKKRPDRGGLASHIDDEGRNKTGLTLGM